MSNSFDFSQNAAVELELDADLWREQLAYMREHRTRNQKLRETYECGADPGDGRGRRVYSFKPGENQIVPKAIVETLIHNSLVWQLVRDDDGKIVLRHDHDNPPLPLLRVVREHVPQIQSEPGQKVQLAQHQCPICEEVFEDQDKFKEHIEETHVAAAAKARRGPGRPRKQPINKPAEEESDDE